MSLQDFFTTFIQFINGVIIPFLLGLAFLLFIINVIRYFVIGGSNQESQEKARATALYGVFAFTFLLIFWGIVNMLNSAWTLDDCVSPQSDYVQMNTGGLRDDPCVGNESGGTNMPDTLQTGPDGIQIPDPIPVG